MTRKLLLGMALAISACSPQVAVAERTVPAAQSAPAIHPESGLEVVPLTVEAQGGTHQFRVEMARTPEQQQMGLMFRKAMGADEGMLFPYAQPRRLSFWMKNTVLPLDIIFIDPDGKVVNVAANAVPYSEEPLSSAGPASAVLELNAGRAAQLGIGPGTAIRW
ncbi:MAG: hypothetical protein RLZZ08_310 [Pseudomonadota bacterium]|jgi:uncharacterized membrane protein (UPF0127 family)